MSERNRAETLSFLGEHGLIYVSVDEPQGFPSSIPPIAAVTNDDLAIVRFHGRNAENWKKPGLTAAEETDDGEIVVGDRSEEHTSELQSLTNLVCRLLLEKKKKHNL